MVLAYHLRQAFHYGAFAYARLAYEYGVVLLPAAKYFGNALYLALASHYGVELSLGGGLRKVGAEVVEYGRLARRPLCCCGACGARLLRVVAVDAKHTVVFVFLLVGHTYAVADGVGFLPEICQCVFVVHIVKFKHFFGSVVHVVVQYGEQQVLFVNHLRGLYARLEHGQFQYVAGLLVEHELVCAERLREVFLAHLLFKFFFYGLEIDV